MRTDPPRIAVLLSYIQTFFTNVFTRFPEYLLTFMSIVLEALPFIVFGCVISGALEELLPQRFLQRMLPKKRVLAIMASSLMGFILPMCECGIVPVMRRLLAKGMPASCAITYMLSAPVINPIVLWSTAMAFTGSVDFAGVGGLGMVLLRGGFAFMTAVTVGLVFEWLGKRNFPITTTGPGRTRLIESEESHRLLEEEGVEKAGPAVVQIGGTLAVAAPSDHHHHHEHDGPCDHEHHDHKHEHAHEHKDGCCDHDHDHGHDHAHHHHHEEGKPRTVLQRLVGIADIAVGDFLDIAAFLVIGAAIAAAVRTGFDTKELEALANQPWLAILAMMTFAVVVSLCSEADAFVAANMAAMPLAAKLSFLVLGPMLDLKLLIMYRWVFSPKAVRVIVLTLVVVIFSSTYLLSVLSPWLEPLVARWLSAPTSIR